MNEFERLRARLRLIEQNAQHPARWAVEQGGGVATLRLYGAIGDFWGDINAGDVAREIQDLDVATLNVHINSPGGDVYDGIAIRNALRQHPAHIVVHVDGLAASAASFIAVGGDEVIMGANSELMIHDAWSIALGNADELRTEADNLDRISDNIAGMYAEKAGGTAADWRTVMKAETWYSATEAVAAGLADRLDSDEAAEEQPTAASAHRPIYAHAGRAAAPAPIPVAAMAAPRKETLMNREQLAAALAAGTITQAQYDDGIRIFDALAAAPANVATNPAAAAPQAAAHPIAPAAGIPGEPIAGEYAAGPANVAQPAARVEDRPRTMMSVAREAAEVLTAPGGTLTEMIATVNNALTNVVVADDAGGGFLAPDRIGEVWQASPEGRPHIEALGGSKPLTSTKIEGWKWTQPTPVPAPYAGGLAEIPTDDWKTEKVEETPSRWAFGNKVDRIYTDLGSADLIASLFQLLGKGYDGVSDRAVAADLIAGATPIVAPNTATLLQLMGRSFLQAKKIGANISKMWMSEDQFLAFSDLKISDLPAWIANATGYTRPADGNVSLSNVFDADVDFQLPWGGFLALDRNAAAPYESPRIQLEAQDVAHGGADIGFFAYGGTFIYDARAVLLGSVLALWTATTAIVVGQRVRLAGGQVLEATVAGNTGGTAPTAPAVGATVVDGGVTWKRIS